MAAAEWYRYQAWDDYYGGILPQPSFIHTRIKFIRFSEGWKGWKVKAYPGSEGFGDFLSEGAMPPVLTRRTVNLLGDILSECGVVPFETQEVTKRTGKPMKNPPKLELFAVDPPILSGALDLQRSGIRYFECAPESILAIDHFVFRGHEVARSPIFRLAEDPSTAIVSKAFREAVEKHKLTGLSFHPLNATWEP